MTALSVPAASVTVRSQDAAECAPAEVKAQAVEHADIAGRVDQESVPARRARDIAEINSAGRDEPLNLDNLPGRDLDQDELLALASSIAANPDALAPHIAFDDEQRHYVSLHRDTHVDVWLLCWTPQNDTGWHDHDISSGAVAVVEGSLSEHVLAVGAPSLETEVRAGEAFTFGPDHIHRLVGKGVGSVSVHAYSPPLWRLGQYSVSTPRCPH